jgi:predicted nuclease with RNAse H fold
LRRISQGEIFAGIDLAAQKETTAACVVHDGVVTFAGRGLSDDDLEALVQGCVKVGIDAPFGWPRRFVDAIVAHRDGAGWPEAEARELRLRHTDRFVHAELGVTALSVSTDRIGIVAFRCAGLLARFRESDRSGAGLLCEVYPAAALRRWYGESAKGYRRDAEKRASLLRRLTVDHGIAIGDESRFCDDHVFDAFVCALVARAVLDGKTIPPDDPDLAAEEGWIHLPRR